MFRVIRFRSLLVLVWCHCAAETQFLFVLKRLKLVAPHPEGTSFSTMTLKWRQKRYS